MCIRDRCSIPCKNAWTTAPGTEYMWFNNVETKPGVGYPKEWENQDRYKGGWEIRDGKLHLRAGGKTDKLANIFAVSYTHIDVYKRQGQQTLASLFFWKSTASVFAFPVTASPGIGSYGRSQRERQGHSRPKSCSG